MGGKEALVRRLQKFKKDASRGMPLQRVILFGSQAWGRPRKDSDIDLLIVSRRFKGLNFFQRGARMYDYWTLRMPVDFLCYTPEEFNRLRKQATIVREAVEKGIAI